MKSTVLSWLATIAVSASALLFSQCKGRTTDNVIPNGETAEVVIDSTEVIVSELPDSVSNPADSTPEPLTFQEILELRMEAPDVDRR